MKTGKGRSHGAITILNALFTGVGSAAAVDLPLEARAELAPSEGRGPGVVPDPGSDSPLVREVIHRALADFGPGHAWAGRVSVDSRIPPARGLKSSSAVSTAVYQAVADALGAEPSAIELARVSADASVAVGASATGAFDDALASAAGGVVVTENRPRLVLRHDDLESGWGALLVIPPTPHAPAPSWREAFAARASSATESASLARRGHYAEAMRQNGRLVEPTLGLDYAELRERLNQHGAIAASVSGLGPSLAVLAPWDRLPRLRELVPTGLGHREVVRLISRERRTVGPE